LWRGAANVKSPVSKTVYRPIVGGRRYMRIPDTTPPTAPTLLTPQAIGPTTINVALTYGADSDTGIAAGIFEIQEATGPGPWIQRQVAFPTATYQFTAADGIASNSLYNLRAANTNGAGSPLTSTYSAIQQVQTPLAQSQLAPGAISITTSLVQVTEGGQITINVSRTGAGSAAPTVQADYVFENFTEGTPQPPSRTLEWLGNATGVRSISATAGLVQAARTGNVRITAVRALTGTINPTLGTSQVPVTIVDSITVSGALEVGAGKAYGTIAGAIAALTSRPERTILVYNGTYNEGFATSLSGSQQTPIVLKAAPGNTSVVVTGSLTQGGHPACMHINHPWWDAGEGILLRGTNATGSTADWSGAANPIRGCIIRESNTTVRFKAEKFKQEWYLVPVLATGVVISTIRLTGVDCRVSGTLDQGTTPKQDAADGWAVWAARDSATDILTENSYFHKGGHSVAAMQHPRLLFRQNLVDQDWSDAFGATYGQKSLTYSSQVRAVVEDSVLMNAGKQADNPSTQTLIFNSTNSLARRVFVLHAGNGGAGSCNGITHASTQAPGANNARLCHATVWSCTGSGLGFNDSKIATLNFGPIYVKNCLIANVATGPQNQSWEGHAVYLLYRSSRGKPWQNLLFIENCAFDQDYNILIQDWDGSSPTISLPLSQMQISFPANFKNNIIAAPNFVSTTLPASTDPLTALAQAQANFVPQNASILGKAAPLTTVAAGVSGASTVQLTDAAWFRDAMGWPHLTGDTIYFQGVGSRRVTSISGNFVTLDSGIGVGAGVNVYLGASATPNIGAVL